MKWETVVADERYSTLTPEKKQVLQDRYFNKYVKTDPRYTPDKEPILRSRLFGDEKKESAFNIGISAGKNLLKGATSFFAQIPQVAGGLIQEFGETAEIKPQMPSIADPGFNLKASAFGLGFPLAETVMNLARSNVAKMTTGDEEIANAGKELSAANRRFIDRHRILPDKGTVNQVAFDIGSGGASVLTSLGLTYLTKRPELVAPLFGVIQKGSMYQESREKGKTPGEASNISTMAAIPETALEYVGLNIFINKLRGLKTLPRILLRAGEQAMQEGSQQFSEETIAKMSGIRPESWSDIFKKSAYSAAIGFITGVPAASVATYGENNGILGEFRKAGFTDEEATPIIEKIIEKQAEAIKPEVKNIINEEVKNKDNEQLSPEDIDIIRQEFEKTLGTVIEQGIREKSQKTVKFDDQGNIIKEGEGKPTETAPKTEEVSILKPSEKAGVSVGQGVTPFVKDREEAYKLMREIGEDQYTKSIESHSIRNMENIENGKRYKDPESGNIYEAEIFTYTQGEKLKGKKGIRMWVVDNNGKTTETLGMDNLAYLIRGKINNEFSMLEEVKQESTQPAPEVKAEAKSVESKEPWQMTKDEFIEDSIQIDLKNNVPRDISELNKDKFADEHRKEIYSAVNQGKPVPPEVLKDYPELHIQENANIDTSSVATIKQYYDNNIKGKIKDVTGAIVEFADKHFSHLVKQIDNRTFSRKRAEELPLLKQLITDPDEIRGAEKFSKTHKSGRIYIREFTHPKTKTKVLLAVEVAGEKLHPITSYSDLRAKQLKEIYDGKLIYKRGTGLASQPSSEIPVRVTKDSTARNLPQQDIRLGGISKPVDSLPESFEKVKDNQQNGIFDFGDKIGGARKDTADRGYTKTPKIKPTSEGPAWRQKYIAAEQAMPRSGQEGFVDIVGLLNIGSWDRMRQVVEDDWIKVKRIIEKTGTIVTEQNNPYEAEIRYWGRLGARMEAADNVISDIDNDIVKTAKKLNMSDKVLNKEIDKFLVANHASERNAVHGPNAAGMTDQEAFNIILDINSKPYSGEVTRIANKIRDLNKQTLDVLFESQVISQEQYNNLRTLYPNHIPLQRVMSDQEDIVTVLTGRGFGVKGTGLKRAKGSELEVADILTNVTVNYKAALIRAEKNIVDLHTLQFARDNNYFDGLMKEFKAQAIGKTFDDKIILEIINEPSVLPIREKGKQIYLKINDAQLAMALRGINRQKIDGLMRGIKAFTRFYSGLMTRFNPEFVVSNKVRDLQEVAIYLASKNEIGFKGTAEAIVKDPVSIKDVTDALRGKDTPGAQLYKQMKMDGGTTGGLGLSTREQIELDLDNIRNINRSNGRKAAEAILRSIDAWNTIFEDSSRLSVYRQALKQGVSRERAAVLAKEASVNFNKMGTGSPILNAIYMFSNASVQGTYKMARAMKNPKVASLVLTFLGGAVFLINAYNDDKDKDWRKKVKKWDRLNGLNIVISTNKGIKYITIPISWGLKPIKVFFDGLDDLVTGQDIKMSDAISNLIASTIESYNPVGGTDAISAITPSILDLPVDIARNRSWTGGKIRPDWNNSAPGSIQYFDSLRKEVVGQGFIQMTKEWGDRGIEISPANINYAYEQLIGGAGRFVDKVFNTIVGATQGKIQSKEIPFVSRFYRAVPEEEIREFGRDYAELKRKLQLQDKHRFYLNQEAELAWDGMKKIPLEDRKRHYIDILSKNPRLAEKIKQIAEEEKLNLTYTDRLINNLGVENGERSKYIWEKIKQLKTIGERKSVYTDLVKKKIITEEVARQIRIRAKLNK